MAGLAHLVAEAQRSLGFSTTIAGGAAKLLIQMIRINFNLSAPCISIVAD
jgi:hypothetical protein